MGLKQTASRLIAKHGQTAKLLRPGEDTVDGWGQPVPGADTEYPITILTAQYAVEVLYIAGGSVGLDDRRVLVSTDGLAVTPETTDRLEIAGEVFRTLRVSPLAPAGEVLFWELQVRDNE